MVVHNGTAITVYLYIMYKFSFLLKSKRLVYMRGKSIT